VTTSSGSCAWRSLSLPMTMNPSTTRFNSVERRSGGNTAMTRFYPQAMDMNLIEHAWSCTRAWLVIAFASFSAVAWAGSNKAPTVNITAPAAGATFGAPANITISATASDTDGTVAKVEFFQGSTKLGEKPASPYDFTWTNASPASYGYSLTAKATDNAGATTTSSAVNIIVSGAGSGHVSSVSCDPDVD